METRGNRQKLTETTGDAQVSKTAGKITLEKPTETDGNRRKPTELRKCLKLQVKPPFEKPTETDGNRRKPTGT
jgi:hypothetical protein